MKIEIRTSNNSIKLLSADEVFVAMCQELIGFFAENEKIAVEDRKSAIEFVKSYEQRFFVHHEETKTFVFEIKVSFPKIRRLINRIVNNKVMLQIRKIIVTITKEVFIKLMVEIILSLIHKSDKVKGFDALTCNGNI
ncbi:MAG: hypothetical protein PUB52_02965 [Lachnospiraceae bacterium]|nr:hypothetical protein [Lachnospiraceae bacterium]